MPDFFALPFPTDLRLKADGTIDLRGFPGGRAPETLASYLAIIERETRGWGTNSAAYFRFTAPVDPASLPADAAAATRDDASIFLMDVDPSSPQRGTRIPLQFRYYAQATIYVPDRVLAVLPLTGFPLRGKTRYAAVVTRRVRDANGRALTSSPVLESVKSRQPSSDPDVERARALHATALDELEARGITRADVVGIAVFTTQDPTGELTRVREDVHRNVPAPVAENVACIEETLYIRCTGQYDTPSYQVGTPPYSSAGGNLFFEASGRPVVQRTEKIPFTLTYPKSAPPATGYPVALVAHGTGGDRNSFLGSNDTGDLLAREGIAAIGIDQPLHGARDTFCPSNPDQREQCEGLWTFNPSNIAAARDNFRQGAIDNFQLLRLVKALVVPRDISRVDAEVRFDPAKIYFFGHSQGGITGPLFLAVEPEVKGAVLSGSGGSLALALLLKTEPVDIRGLVELLLNIEGENELDTFHPVMTAFQTFVERADPLNYAAALLSRPPTGGVPKHILITEGLGDSYTPNAVTEAFAVSAGVSPVAPVLRPVEGFALLGRSVLTAPVTGNFGASGMTATAVLAQYAAAPDAATNPSHDGHFVVYWNATARRQYASFLGSLARTGAATFPAP
jgi:pimeloyl-ACP methyl ester carboxylesterase